MYGQHLRPISTEIGRHTQVPSAAATRIGSPVRLMQSFGVILHSHGQADVLVVKTVRIIIILYSERESERHRPNFKRDRCQHETAATEFLLSQRVLFTKLSGYSENHVGVPLEVTATSRAPLLTKLASPNKGCPHSAINSIGASCWRVL
jgi:hypothetical protein